MCTARLNGSCIDRQMEGGRGNDSICSQITNSGWRCGQVVIFYFSFSLFVSFSISFNKIPVAEGPGDTNKTRERFFSALSGSIRLIHMHDNISDICGMKGGPARSSLCTVTSKPSLRRLSFYSSNSC